MTENIGLATSRGLDFHSKVIRKLNTPDFWAGDPKGMDRNCPLQRRALLKYI
jgi:hypothetical protein